MNASELKELIGNLKNSSGKGKSSGEDSYVQKALAKALGEASTRNDYDASRSNKNIVVSRSGDVDHLIVPEDMNYLKAANHLTRMYEAEEKIVEYYRAVPGIPTDSLFAIWDAIKATFGFSEVVDTPTFFGPQPPVMVSFPVGYGKTASTPYGRISPPMLEGGWIAPSLDKEGLHLGISGEIKTKFRAKLDEVVDLAEKFVAGTGSIYRGQAISLDLNYLGTREAYNPTKHAPMFLTPSTKSPVDLVLNQSTEFLFQTVIYPRLQQRERLAEKGIRFKHGIMLAGPYGVGKTLTAAVLQKMAVDHGITFINLLSPTMLARALDFAKMYGPTVLFCEDADSLFNGQERSLAIDAILNTLDGVGSKEVMDVMLVMTSNHPDRISSAFMRAGRVDTLISVSYPDEATIPRLITQMAGERIDNSVALDPEVRKALSNKSPAFVKEILEKAYLASWINSPAGTSDTGIITRSAILNSANTHRDHEAAAAHHTGKTDIEQVTDAIETLREKLQLSL